MIRNERLQFKPLKKLWSVIFILCFFSIGCSSHSSSIRKEITHAKFTDNCVVIEIGNESYELQASSHTIQKFKDFYRDYSSKITKQSLNLTILTNRKTDFTYSFFIEANRLDKKTKSKLESLYQAKLYKDKYIMVSFTANAKSYYYGKEKENISVNKYKLENPIPILITENTPFVETGGGQDLLLLTMPVWVPFMILFGLKV